MCGCAGAGALVALFVIVLVLAAICCARSCGAVLGGRAPPPRSPHVVVDTLNLAHWLRGESARPLAAAEIIAAIDKTAPILKKKHAGRVMYVLKDRESQLNGEAAHAEFMACAERNRVYIITAEKYADDPPSGNPRSTAHSAAGRDDFLVAVLARRWRCAALTEDRLRDFGEFRSALQPFHVYEHAYWRASVAQEYYRPESPAYSRLRKPRTVGFAEYFKRDLIA